MTREEFAKQYEALDIVLTIDQFTGLMDLISQVAVDGYITEKVVKSGKLRWVPTGNETVRYPSIRECLEYEMRDASRRFAEAIKRATDGK